MAVKGPLTIGLDIGIASVGWAVLAPNRIVDMGVRAFDAAEDKDGKPHNQTRRGARVSRNRYDMRAWRLKKLVRLFRDVGMLSKREIKHLFSAEHDKNQPQLVSPWQLRAEGISRPLAPQEWAQVIYHLVKHRGFKFFSKTEDPASATSDDEESASNKSAEIEEREGLREGLNYTATLLTTYPQFKTLGYAAYQLGTAQQDKDGIYRDSDGNRLKTKDCEEFQNAYRNKDKSYRHAFRRDDLMAELATLFDAQQRHGNPYTNLPLPVGTEQLSEVAVSSERKPVSSTFRDQVFALLELQHPPITAGQMDALIGYCELENEARNGKGKAERRAAKHGFSNERATWLQILNNFHIKRNGKPEDQLSADERAVLIDLPYVQTKVTFKQAREVLREKVGFPAHWREASFTMVSYRNKRKDDGSWINVVAADGTRKPLGKYGQDDVRKKANKTLKERLESSTMTFAELRQLYKVPAGENFEHQRKDEAIILASLEDQYLLPFEALDNKEAFIKILPAKSKKALTFKRKAMEALASLRAGKPNATLADLRIAIEKAEHLDSGWQFECSRKDSKPIRLEDEATTTVPIEYEDAQKAEEDTLIELKGWHGFKRVLEKDHPEWWASMQVAWRNPQSDAGQAAAHQLNEIAEVLTKVQTDIDVEKGLASLQITKEQIDALEGIRFKQYRNLSLKALRNILPFLEQAKSYKEACDLAGYRTITFQRTRHLPPLQTYLYERIRHGKATGYTEQRYKDLTNPVVARAFNQARLVINALIDRYQQSPAYVHVELARDIAKPLKGRWSNGKYIEGRLDIQKKQEENRNKRASARKNFIETHEINEPTGRQMLKERLYREQQCICPYTLKEFDPYRVVHEDNYAQIDHIWPRSLTFDNSMENLVLVHAHANQDKGNRIPYDFVTQKYGAEHWRKVEAYVLSCKGMSDNKQKRLLAKELDADEFLARNLVDTRYATRLFARMVRERLLFDGQAEDKIEDIAPSESGKSRLDKFHKSRVRTPQGGVVSFLRGKWLGDIKDREAGDKHHAMDACIIAACTPELIHRVNSWFSNEEKVPSRFKRNDDGTYTDRGTRTEQGTGEIVSKQEARERGLYLAPPWDGFRNEFRTQYESVFVSRAVRKKRNNEAHDANPLAWKQAYRRLRVPLQELSLAKLDPKRLSPDFYSRNSRLIDALRTELEKHKGDADRAFAEPYYLPKQDGDELSEIIKAIRLPQLTQKKIASKTRLADNGLGTSARFTDRTAHKTTALTSLKLDMLTEKNLGEQYYRRNKLLIDALVDRLNKHNDDAEKAFKEPFRKPLNPEHNSKRQTPLEEGPIVRSIRLPKNKESGLHVRGGVAELGDSLRTEIYWTGKGYFFRPRYKAREDRIFGIEPSPEGAVSLFSITQNDLLEVKLGDGTSRFGYFVMYEGDGRLQIRDHDQPKKGAHRFGINKIKHLKKYKISVLGEILDIPDQIDHGLA